MPKEEKQENSEKKAPAEDGVAVKRPGILTGEEIEQLGLVDPPSKECLRATCYDLRLGPEVFVCGKKKPKFINLEEKGLKGITIESFGTIIFSTREKIDLLRHKNIVGRFGLKIGRGLDGLILQVGPQVEPGYKGPLFGVLLNTRGEGKTVMLDERFLAIEFSRTSSIPGKDLLNKNVKEIKSLYEFLIRSQHIDPDYLARPSVIQQVRDTLDNCRVEHGLKRSMDDSKWLRKSAKRALWILIITIFGLLIAYPDKISDFKQRIFHNLAKLLRVEPEAPNDKQLREQSEDANKLVPATKTLTNERQEPNEIK